MSNQTVSTNKNFDDASLSGLLNGENITIDTGATLTINSDVRWGQNAAVIGAMTIDTTAGGKILMDGTTVWWAPFDASTGNVPALGTCGTPDVTRDGSNVGEFLGIFTALGVAPSAAAGAMPASGFIKFRSVSTTFADNDVLTFAGGATATLSGAGQRGWIHVVGEEANAIAVPRRGELQVTGDWFQIGETNGADDQTFQYPVPDNCPCFYMEDGSGGLEIWLNAADRWGAASVTVATDVRGKFFGCDNATGIITIARRASNSCGYKPASGRKVYVPNVIISNSTSANWAANTINSTPATRWDFNLTNGGIINIDKCIGTWYLLLSAAYSVSITDTGVLHPMQVDTVTTTLTLDRVGLGANGASSTTSPCSIYYNNAVTISRCVFMRYYVSAEGQYCLRCINSASISISDTTVVIFQSTTGSAHAAQSIYGIVVSDTHSGSVSNCSVIGGTLTISGSSNITVSGTKYADSPYGETQTTNAFNGAIWIASSSRNVTVTGFSNFGGIANVHPYGAMIQCLSGVNNVTISDIGSPSAEYDCGSANATNVVISFNNCWAVTARRIYCKNVRGYAVAVTTTSYDILAENVWGDAGDTLVLYGKSNILNKGGRATLSVNGVPAACGIHWTDNWVSTTAGRLHILCQEPTTTTAAQCVASGTAKFNGAGGVVFPALNDSVTWTMPYFMLGVTSFSNTAPTLRGTNTGYCTYEFQYNLGSSWNDSWLALTGGNLNAIGAITPSTGVKLMVRATRSSGATAPTLTQIQIETTTDATSQQIQYPLPFNAAGLITNIVAGSTLQIWNQTTATEIYNAVVAGTSYTHDYYNGTGITTGDVIRIRLTYTGAPVAKLPYETFVVATASGWSVYASQSDFTVYNVLALDSSDITVLQLLPQITP